MAVRAVRGAVQVDGDDAGEMARRVGELLKGVAQ
ncbi:hypothetical protein Saa2_07459 [Streptomyces acidiscabies]|nr:hypothetical protein Saa2_07459 [Streptomyces acidiscabies]